MFDSSKKLDSLYQKGNWDELIKAGEKLLLNGTNDIKVLNDLAVAYWKKKRTADALKTCDMIYLHHPESDTMKQSINLGVRYMRHHQVMGEILYEKGEYEKALKIFDSLKCLGSNFSEKYYLSAKIYVRQKKYDLALSEYQTLIKKCPHRVADVIEGLLEFIKEDAANERAYTILFEAYKKEGSLQEEISQCERSARSKKDIFDVYLLGNFYRCAGQPEKAIALFSEYGETDPNVPLFLGNLHLSKGEFQKAVAGYKHFYERNPEKRGVVIERLEKVLAQAKNDEGLMLYLANLYLDDGRFAASEEKIRALLQNNPANTAYQAKLEEILLQATDHFFMEGNLETARDFLGKLIKIKPGQNEYHARLKDIEGFIVQNKIGEYEGKLKQGNLSEGEEGKIQFELGMLYLKKNADEKSALSLFQKAAKGASEYQPEALYQVGMSFLSKGMVELAYENFKKIMESHIADEKKVELLYQIGTVYEEKGIVDKAREVYSRIISRDIAYKDVAQRMERLPASTAAGVQKDKGQSALDGRYENREKIGAGGMGAIFKARDRILGRTVALKVIRDDVGSDTEAIHRFIREAQSASALQHPGIVTIYDIHVESPIYIAMEFVEGGTLRERLKKGALPIQEFLKMAVEICEALDAAHAKGIIHRDIKPENIMLTNDAKIKVTDFGLASFSNATKMTVVGQILGTPLYMSPEQIKGMQTDNRSDVYSLGITFYEMLTGKAPFPDGDISYRHIHETPESPSLINPTIPDPLEKIVMRSIQKKPEDRYQNVRDIIEDLKRC